MKRIASITLALALCAGLFAGCSGKAASSSSAASSSAAPSSSASQSASSADSSSASSSAAPALNFSEGLTDSGFFEGITALDYVTLPEDYNKIALPADVATVSDATVQTQVDTLMSDYAEPQKLKDRAVQDGDSVNIDYVGSVDGVEFDGGSTKGAGTSVVAGSTNYIDDFLTQIIGHKPGETFDVNVTFPDPYSSNTDLSGKDAVFKTTINYIEGEKITPTLTDEFVATNLKASYGWDSVQAMKDAIRTYYKQKQVSTYVWKHVVDDSTISEVPASVTAFVKSYITNSMTMQAAQYGYTVEQFLSMTGSGATTIDEYFEKNLAALADNAKQSLVTQAIAEKAGISATDDDLKKMLSTDDFSQYESAFGMPYLRMACVSNLVGEYLANNATGA